MKTLDGLKARRRTEEARVGHNEPVGVDGIPHVHTRDCLLLYMTAYSRLIMYNDIIIMIITI